MFKQGTIMGLHTGFGPVPPFMATLMEKFARSSRGRTIEALLAGKVDT